MISRKLSPLVIIAFIWAIFTKPVLMQSTTAVAVFEKGLTGAVNAALDFETSSDYTLVTGFFIKGFEIYDDLTAFEFYIFDFNAGVVIFNLTKSIHRKALKEPILGYFTYTDIFNAVDLDVDEILDYYLVISQDGEDIAIAPINDGDE